MKKKLFLSNKFWFLTWAFYHGGILILFLISMIFTKGIIFDADFTNMMPSATENKAAKIAEKSVSENPSLTFFQHALFQYSRVETLLSILSLNRRYTAQLPLYPFFQVPLKVQLFL